MTDWCRRARDWIARVHVGYDDHDCAAGHFEACGLLADPAAARLGAEWNALQECYRLLKANHDCATYDETTQTCRGCAVSDALAAVEAAQRGEP